MVTPNSIKRKGPIKFKGQKDSSLGFKKMTQSFQLGSSLTKESRSKVGKDGKISYLSFDKRKFTGRSKRATGSKRIKKFLGRSKHKIERKSKNRNQLNKISTIAGESLR
jgi:hypothetical protein